MFRGKVDGEITREEKKKQKAGFGFDPIFKPVNSDRTFAEMDVFEKE